MGTGSLSHLLAELALGMRQLYIDASLLTTSEATSFIDAGQPDTLTVGGVCSIAAAEALAARARVRKLSGHAGCNFVALPPGLEHLAMYMCDCLMQGPSPQAHQQLRSICSLQHLRVLKLDFMASDIYLPWQYCLPDTLQSITVKAALHAASPAGMTWQPCTAVLARPTSAYPLGGAIQARRAWGCGTPCVCFRASGAWSSRSCMVWVQRSVRCWELCVCGCVTCPALLRECPPPCATS